MYQKTLSKIDDIYSLTVRLLIQICQDFGTSGDIVNDAFRSGQMPTSLLVMVFAFIGREAKIQPPMYHG